MPTWGSPAARSRCRLARELGRERACAVVDVVAESPAARAGLTQGDLIVELDGEPIAAAGDLQRLLVGKRIGRELPLTVVRAGTIRAISVRPVELDV